MSLKILSVVGARPNFMKIAPILDAFTKVGIECPLVHTGQHYDADMNDVIFRQLEIPQPDFNLGVGSGTHAEQTAEVMKRFEKVVEQVEPQAILVVGDVNSTIACALVAAKLGIKVVHVEAGLRSYDRSMPEEINRVLTDQISDFLFTTERQAEANLLREGIDSQRIFFVGNVMIDSLFRSLPKCVKASDILAKTGHGPVSDYVLLTLHRPSNVDDAATLERLLSCIHALSAAAGLQVVFPLHPRTRARITEFGLSRYLDDPVFVALPPAGYLEALALQRDARLVVTDSGGIQEETTALGIPCITVRENTERPITISEGTNTLVGTDSQAIAAAFRCVLTDGGKRGRVPEFWDGKAAERIAAILIQHLAGSKSAGPSL